MSEKSIEPIYSKIGKQIARRRSEMGMSQTALARRMGLRSPVSVSNIELGNKRIMVHQIILAARALKVRLGYLLGAP